MGGRWRWVGEEEAWAGAGFCDEEDGEEGGALWEGLGHGALVRGGLVAGEVGCGRRSWRRACVESLLRVESGSTVLGCGGVHP